MRASALLLTLVPLLLAAKSEGIVDLNEPDKAPPLSNSMEDRLTQDQYPDTAPVGQPSDAVMDEARITSITRKEACFRIITRTDHKIEEGSRTYVFKVNGKEILPDEEPTVRVYDYPKSGRRRSVNTRSFTDAASGAVRVPSPKMGVFRVVERTWEVCGKPGVKKDRVDLHVLLKPRVKGPPSLIERYRWTVR